MKIIATLLFILSFVSALATVWISLYKDELFYTTLILFSTSVSLFVYNDRGFIEIDEQSKQKRK
jgi:hypothetical protein